MSSNRRQDTLLLVEDNPADADLTRDSFARVNSQVSIEVASNGVQAMSYLNRENGYHDAVRPRLILLDLNLPGLDGRGVLREVKANEGLRRIPVIVWSSSRAHKDINDCYELGANFYLVKPLDLHAYRDVIGTVERFWLGTACLPNSNGGLARR